MTLELLHCAFAQPVSIITDSMVVTYDLLGSWLWYTPDLISDGYFYDAEMRSNKNQCEVGSWVQIDMGTT